MPDLAHRLRTHDLGFLQIIAELWGIELFAPDAKTALPALLHQLLEPGMVQEILESLPAEPRQALDTLILHDGKMEWSRFVRLFGELREVGPGKRDREKPYLDPVSATEILWYRGLIGRDFLRHGKQLEECAYIPDDLLERMPSVEVTGPQPLGRAASPGETLHSIRAADRILDHSCTLLAALRLGEPHRSPAVNDWQPPFEVVHALLSAVKLISSNEQPVVEDARPFLEMKRGAALSWLVKGWLVSDLFDELRLMPAIVCEGSWHRDSAMARNKVLEFLSEIPAESWWNLDSFIKGIYEREPDFQRPAGDFDSWLVREAATGALLTGISHWDEVDGALIRYLMTGPMHWLGLIDLASPGEGQPVTAFRLSDWSEKLLLGQPAEGLAEENEDAEVFSDGSLLAGRYLPRLARYQLSRFCLWTEETDTHYVYQITPGSLEAAIGQGLKIIHLEKLLSSHALAVPPVLIKALHQWQKKGSQVRMQPGMVLRVEDPAILIALRDTPAGRFLGDILGPTSALIYPGTADKVADALARLGYLSDIEDQAHEWLLLDEADHD